MMQRLPMIQSLLWITVLFKAKGTAFQNRPFGVSSRVVRHRTTSALSASDHFDMEELRQRIQQESNPYQQIFAASSTQQPHVKPEKVHIILFNPGTEEQGAHTIEYPRGSGSNVVLAFESLSACKKFAASLKEQNFFDPTPQEFKLDEIHSICEKLGVFVQVVPEGIELIPPSENVKSLGHDPNLRSAKSHLEYIFDMIDSELEEVGVLEVIPSMDLGSNGSWE